jgi:hypothetical protein
MRSPVGEHGGDRKSEVRSTDQSVHNTLMRGSTNATYLAARIKKQRPDIAAAIADRDDGIAGQVIEWLLRTAKRTAEPHQPVSESPHAFWQAAGRCIEQQREPIVGSSRL